MYKSIKLAASLLGGIGIGLVVAVLLIDKYGTFCPVCGGRLVTLQDSTICNSCGANLQIEES